MLLGKGKTISRLVFYMHTLIRFFPRPLLIVFTRYLARVPISKYLLYQFSILK